MGLTDETWSIRASNSLSRNAPNDVRTPRSGCTDDKSVGTDFRYAVEFSKYGRTPSAASRPPQGQPDLRYRLTSTTPNRLGPPPPDALAQRVLRQTPTSGAHFWRFPRAVQLAADFSSDPSCCAVPLGAWTKLRGDCLPRQTRRSAALSIIICLNRCRSQGRAGAADRRPAGSGDAVHIRSSEISDVHHEVSDTTSIPATDFFPRRSTR
jgi:hypothetical protein